MFAVITTVPTDIRLSIHRPLKSMLLLRSSVMFRPCFATFKAASCSCRHHRRCTKMACSAQEVSAGRSRTPPPFLLLHPTEQNFEEKTHFKANRGCCNLLCQVSWCWVVCPPAKKGAASSGWSLLSIMSVGSIDGWLEI